MSHIISYSSSDGIKSEFKGFQLELLDALICTSKCYNQSKQTFIVVSMTVDINPSLNLCQNIEWLTLSTGHFNWEMSTQLIHIDGLK